MPDSSRWVVVASDFGDTDKHDAVLVTAETEQEAAEIGAEMLQEMWDDSQGLADLTIEHVFVGPWPRTVYTVTRQFTAEISGWQCCGGPNESGGHYGGCPTRREELNVPDETDQKELTMDLKEAERLIGLAVENPSANVPTESLALANATVLLRSGLIGMTLSQETITVVTTESTDGG